MHPAASRPTFTTYLRSGGYPNHAPDERSEMYHVTTIYGNALDREQAFPNDSRARAFAAADQEAKDCAEAAAKDGESWEVYVLHGDVQFATDHHPYKSSADEPRSERELRAEFDGLSDADFRARASG